MSITERHRELVGKVDAVGESIDADNSIFVVPALDGYLLHAPLHGVSALISKEAGDALKSSYVNLIPDLLTAEMGFSFDKQIRFPGITARKDWKPTSVTFSNTQKCTLRCSYCYAEGGRLEDKVIDISVAAHAIDLIVENSRDMGVRPSINFLGEGEATADWKSFTAIIKYFQERCDAEGLEKKVELSTNGVFSDKYMDFLCDNVDEIYISLDGIPHVSDQHRLLPNGKGSSAQILATMEEFDRRNKPYSLRATVGKAGSERMVDFVRFIANNTNCKFIHFEPAFDIRALVAFEAEIDLPHAVVFVSNFRRARAEAARLGVELYFSGTDTSSRDSFCGATDGRNFIVLSDGSITSCNEVMRDTDFRSGLFKYGSIKPDASVPTGRVHIDANKLEALSELRSTAIDKCNTCFAKFNCGGDCYAKTAAVAKSVEISDKIIYTDRCFAIRELLADNILIEIARNGGIIAK